MPIRIVKFRQWRPAYARPSSGLSKSRENLCRNLATLIFIQVKSHNYDR